MAGRSVFRSGRPSRSANSGGSSKERPSASSTAPAEVLREIIGRVLPLLPFRALSIAARPDCLPPAILDLLSELKGKLDIYVELGCQTVHERTLQFIGRGHDWICSRNAILSLAQRDLQVIPHLILGLPGEDREDILDTAKTMAGLPLGGLKLHNLHVIKGTPLAEHFAAHPFKVFSEKEYASILSEFIRHIPDSVPLLRLSTDTPPERRIAPHWRLGKGQFLDHLVQRMIAAGHRQGDLTSGGGALSTAAADIPWPLGKTQDGYSTPIHPRYAESIHPLKGGLESYRKNFVEPARALAAGLKQVRILDIGFGAGLLGWMVAEAVGEGGSKVRLVGLESDRRVLEQCLASKEDFSLPEWKEAMAQLLSEGNVSCEFGEISLRWGEARELIGKESSLFDLILLDPFSPRRNAELWTRDFFARIIPLLAKGGAVLSSSVLPQVRRGFEGAGYLVLSTPGMPRWKAGLMASRGGGKAVENARAASDIPYRDPEGIASAKRILT
ncbi:MAG: TIGR01212 family radical SAM protein, partial [Planctomycetes bacterium]|nr:TIGR01212 family radical SAM protein [Planctomycetota bacterium]